MSVDFKVVKAENGFILKTSEKKGGMFEQVQWKSFVARDENELVKQFLELVRSIK